MSDTTAVLLAVIAALPPTLVAAASLIASLRNSKSIARVQEQTNGMQQAMIQNAEEKGHREGRLQERSEQKDR